MTTTKTTGGASTQNAHRSDLQVSAQELRDLAKALDKLDEVGEYAPVEGTVTLSIGEDGVTATVRVSHDQIALVVAFQ